MKTFQLNIIGYPKGVLYNNLWFTSGFHLSELFKNFSEKWHGIRNRFFLHYQNIQDMLELVYLASTRFSVASFARTCSYSIYSRGKSSLAQMNLPRNKSFLRGIYYLSPLSLFQCLMTTICLWTQPLSSNSSYHCNGSG